jgi:ATPase subunit of ABC transporter with duplicated ATPase domains
VQLNAVIWLDEYLQKWKKTLLVVSHDQDVLNSITQEILHIEDLKLCSYKGNYDSFKKAEHTKFLQQVKAWEKQEKRLKELKRSGHSKSKAEETLLKSTAKRESGGRNQKKKDQAVAAGTESAENTELVKRPKEYRVKLEFVEVGELSRPVMEVSNVHFRYSPKHPIIFDKIDFGIDKDSRVCIVGPNGAGKVGRLLIWKRVYLTTDVTVDVVETSDRRVESYRWRSKAKRADSVRTNRSTTVPLTEGLQHGDIQPALCGTIAHEQDCVEYLLDLFPEEDCKSIRN